MRDYGKVVPQFWTRGSGRELRGKPVAQVLALYLMTAPGSTMVGLYYLPTATICHDTGLTLNQVFASLGILETLDIAFYDIKESLVYLPAGAKHQLGPTLARGDKRRIGLIKDLQSMGSHGFVLKFWKRYQTFYELGDPPAWLLCEGGVPPLPEPQKGAAPADLFPGSQDQDQDQKQDQEQEQNNPRDPREDSVFEKYIEGWQRTVGKGAAPKFTTARRRLIRKRLKDHSLEDVLAAVVGIWLIPFNVENGYTSIELALRNAEKVELYSGKARAAPAATQSGRSVQRGDGSWDAEEARRRDALAEQDRLARGDGHDDGI